MATTPLSAVGTALQSVGVLLQNAANGGVGAPAQQQAAAQPAPAPQAPVDQFTPGIAPGEPNPAAGPAAGGKDQLAALVGGLVSALQQVVQLLQQLVGGKGQGGQAPQGGQEQGAAAQGGRAQGGGAASASAAAAAAAAAGGASASASASASVGGVSAEARAAAAAAASSGAVDSSVPPQPESQPQPSGGDGGGDGGGGGDPLVFDLGGRGVGFDTASTTQANLNGKGGEKINDLAAGTGLLTFDATPGNNANTFEQGKGLLSGTFGDKTDLSGYGIRGDRPDGTFSNGFAAIRALGEHFGLIKPGDQVLSGDDLKVLEEKAGVKMRVGGVNGQDKSLADLGITQINLGDPNAVQSLDQASRDANGNLLQRQAGASFTINGQNREYADAWFKEQSARPV